MQQPAGSISNCSCVLWQGFTLGHCCLVCQSPATSTTSGGYRVQFAKTIMQNFARWPNDTISRWLNLRHMMRTRLFFIFTKVTSLPKAGSITIVRLMISFRDAPRGVDQSDPSFRSMLGPDVG